MISKSNKKQYCLAENAFESLNNSVQYTLYNIWRTVTFQSPILRLYYTFDLNCLELYNFLVKNLQKRIHHEVPYCIFQNSSSDLMLRSVLGHILPEAMVCYLENYSPEKFAQIFLGEFDTPEAIWNAEMRFVCYIHRSNFRLLFHQILNKKKVMKMKE